MRVTTGEELRRCLCFQRDLCITSHDVHEVIAVRRQACDLSSSCFRNSTGAPISWGETNTHGYGEAMRRRLAWLRSSWRTCVSHVASVLRLSRGCVRVRRMIDWDRSIVDAFTIVETKTGI